MSEVAWILINFLQLVVAYIAGGFTVYRQLKKEGRLVERGE